MKCPRCKFKIIVFMGQRYCANQACYYNTKAIHDPTCNLPELAQGLIG